MSNDNSALLARRITWKSSKQSFLTAILLADWGLKDDCLRAYAYFRWADDRVDLAGNSAAEKAAFIERQKSLVEAFYNRQSDPMLCREERMLEDLVAHDRGGHTGLHSFIIHFLKVLEFDAWRGGSLVSREELEQYTGWLSTAVMDGIQYFIGNKTAHPQGALRLMAVGGAHLVHMLRDMLEDMDTGIVNIPREEIPAGFQAASPDVNTLRNWVKAQSQLAEGYFESGRKYIKSLRLLRSKLAGVCYCARFEHTLRVIEKDGYLLRRDYHVCRSPLTWLQMAGLVVATTLEHLVGKMQRKSIPETGRDPQWQETGKGRAAL